MTGGVSRRTFLAGLLATAACSTSRSETSETTTTAAGGPIDRATVDAVLPSDPFTLGVASGDPDAGSVVLWTRLMQPGTDRVALDVATDQGFTDLVRSTVVPVDVERGSSVHAVVDGLQAGTTYWYRFRVGAFTSVTGRTRTAPDAPLVPLRLAVASCQRRSDGRWAAHRDIAAADVDLVVFLGDYIYEDATTLDEYRSHYEAARLDPHLAAAHAAHPWAITWDDHEVANDYAGAGAIDPARKQAAYQAWWEHQPVRLPPPTDGALAVHRRLRWGSTADLLLLDTRQHRSAPACGGGIVERAACGDLDADDRTMLGAEQEAWLAASVDGDQAWTVVAQSVVLTPVDILDRVNADAWDGYPAARQRLLDVLPAGGRSLLLTGDIHVQLVGDAAPGVTELVAPSISSLAAEPFASAAEFLPLVAPTVRHAADRRGWLRCDVDAESWRATYREVVDPADPASAVVDGPTFTS